jgi:diguanylate cyclase (GGDEF)-like protein
VPDVRALADALAAMDAAPSVDDVLARLAAAVRERAGARAVAVLTGDGGTWTVVATAGPAAPAAGTVLLASAACGAVAADGVPGEAGGEDALVDVVGPALVLPVPGRGSVVGVVAVAPPPELDDAAAAELELLARHAGLHLVLADDAAVRDDLLQERGLAMGALARLAGTDALTGAANRAGLLRLLGSLCGRGQAVGVVLLDLDRFKAVNDSLGHEAGDALLQQVAGRLQGLVRPTDVVGRLGGDEFLLVVRDADLPALRRLADRVDDVLGEPFDLHGTPVEVRASAGAAVAVPGTSPADLLRAADEAMYARKRWDGRGAPTGRSLRPGRCRGAYRYALPRRLGAMRS